LSAGLSAASIDFAVADAAGTARRDLFSEKRARRVLRTLEVLLLVAAAGFLGLHFVHLNADFPNGSPWMDWSKYTDEGWYGDAAIRQIQLGHWYVRGDFNPAVALPVWPVLEYVLFSVTGVSVVAARALSVSVFGGILVAAYLLVRRCSLRSGSFDCGGVMLAPAAAVVLLAVSPFCYAITRLAVLEPLLILLTLLALLAASSTRLAVGIAGLGMLIPLMILTKTTAVFLLPSVAWMLWASCGYRLRPFLRMGVPAAAIAGGLWSAYFFLLVRPRFLEDYRYLFSANGYTGITRENAWSVIEDTLYHGFWMGRLMYPVAIAAILLALACFRRSSRNPAVPCLLLWAGGYMGFLAYHNNLQPRYYLVIAVPMTMLIPVAAEEAIRSISWHRKPRQRADRAVLLLAVSGTLLFLMLWEGAKTLHYVSHPEYTFEKAAQGVRRTVLADAGQSHLVLSISGSDLSLMTGLPSICDDFGTMNLEDRVALYRPGWYATWNQVDDDKMDALAPLYHLVRVESFAAFDDPERNLLILYRLDPPGAEEPPNKKGKVIPKQLRTKLGQQPSASQLEH
jgi:hypothetical protein